MEEKDYSNIASTLREIASNSDKTIGKILLNIEKAAKDGNYFLTVKSTKDVYEYLKRHRFNNTEGMVVPVIIEKLFSLGFRLSAEEKLESGWISVNNNYYLTIYW